MDPRVSPGALVALWICESSETPFRILLKASGQFSPLVFLLDVRGREFRKICFISHLSCVREELEPSLPAAASRASRPPRAVPCGHRSGHILGTCCCSTSAPAAPCCGSSALGSSRVTTVAWGGLGRAGLAQHLPARPWLCQTGGAGARRCRSPDVSKAIEPWAGAEFCLRGEQGRGWARAVAPV